jgi:hypothetical protein
MGRPIGAIFPQTAEMHPQLHWQRQHRQQHRQLQHNISRATVINIRTKATAVAA